MLINCKRGKAISLPFQSVATPTYPRHKGTNKNKNIQMIVQEIKLNKYNWVVHAYYSISTYYVEDIMEHLWEIGIDGESAQRAYDNMIRNELDLCYSNYIQRQTIIVIAPTSSAKEFLNSMTHESGHACVHIATANYRPKVGKFCLEICMAMYPKIKHFVIVVEKEGYE